MRSFQFLFFFLKENSLSSFKRQQQQKKGFWNGDSNVECHHRGISRDSSGYNTTQKNFRLVSQFTKLYMHVRVVLIIGIQDTPSRQLLPKMNEQKKKKKKRKTKIFIRLLPKHTQQGSPLKKINLSLFRQTNRKQLAKRWLL